MASTPHQKQPEPRYVDIPDLPETFADSVRFVGFDGQTWRIELTVTRMRPDLMAKMPKHIQDAQEQYPSCRLVLTVGSGLDLINKLTQTASALESQGVIKKNQPPQTPFVMPEQKGPH